MIIKVKMTVPYALEDAITEAFGFEGSMDPETGIYEIGQRAEEKIEEIKSICERWFDNSETVTLIIDTDAETCTIRNN